ncbi:nitronate monooxygenase [Blastococcus brunescens]|uniref:Nitronate monooxygenase n=1 Tax=Blastococcus brunescens TaxID=1564165 RepID=A0ABZ1AXZ8_9ACTN|nr:nitronate monooxygenase [Blastococcus sp. BMG 8361]WRL63450.1 nitronate monooxygenase [Blastococcus sp. BMG 8361]
MIRTPLTRWFDLTTPVIGAPMAGVSGGALAAAVSRAGGLGMIGVSGSHPAAFVTEQCAIPAADLLPFGVGLMAWVLDDRPDLLEATVAAQPGLVSVSFGDPGPYVGPLHDAGIAVAAQVNTADDVHRAVDAGVDVLVAQGSEAGGHTGQRATLPLLQEVLTLTDRPVVAAGGIATGRGMAAALVAGAAGVWIGTPLLSCPEGSTPLPPGRGCALPTARTPSSPGRSTSPRASPGPSAGPAVRWPTSSAVRGTAARRSSGRTPRPRDASSRPGGATTWSRRRSTPGNRSRS